jgi:carbonic anhydrase
MKQIHTKSPVLEEMLKSGQLGLVGAMYDVETGKTTFYAD